MSRAHRLRHPARRRTRSGSSGSWRSAGSLRQPPEQAVEQVERCGSRCRTTRLAQRRGRRPARDTGLPSLGGGRPCRSRRRRGSSGRRTARASAAIARRASDQRRVERWLTRRRPAAADASRRAASCATSPSAPRHRRGGCAPNSRTPSVHARCSDAWLAGGGERERGSRSGPVGRGRRAWPMAVDDDERQHLLSAARCSATGPRARMRAHAARRQQPSHRLRTRGPARAAAARAGRVEVDRKALAVRQRPGQLRIHVERQHAARPPPTISSCRKAVEAHQPVGLVQAVLAQQRRRLQRQRARRIGDRAEGRVVDALQPIGAVQTWRWWRGSCASLAASAPTIICVDWPAGANARRASAARGSRLRGARWRGRPRRLVDAGAQPRHRAPDAGASFSGASALQALRRWAARC